MTDHPLITYAVRTTHQLEPLVDNTSSYDPVRGYWVVNQQPLVARGNLPATKKADIETGEDLKER